MKELQQKWEILFQQSKTSVGKPTCTVMYKIDCDIQALGKLSKWLLCLSERWRGPLIEHSTCLLLFLGLLFLSFLSLFFVEKSNLTTQLYTIGKHSMIKVTAGVLWTDSHIYIVRAWSFHSRTSHVPSIKADIVESWKPWLIHLAGLRDISCVWLL